MRIRALVRVALALTVTAASVAAQTVTGRVTDTLGVPIPHATILAHPVADSTEAATRVVVTNEQGEFRLQVPARAVYMIRVRRIGFVGEKDQTLDLTSAREAKLVLVLHAVLVQINTVRVAAKAPRAACLPLDDSTQNPTVRDWFDRAVYWIQARRVVERSLSYKVKVTRVLTPAPATPIPENQYSHLPGTGTGQWLEDEFANLAGVARTAGTHRDDTVMPTEMTLLSPLFRLSYCFMNSLAPNADGTWTAQFRDLVARPNTPAITGSLIFASDGLALDSAAFTFTADGRAIGSAHLKFSRVTIEGESYPILTMRSVAHTAMRNYSRASSAAEMFAYWAYTRGQ
jgi:hypothetical protein